MKQFLSVLVILSLIFPGCSKNNDSTGVNVNAYLSVTANSTWNYKTEDKKNSSQSNYTLTATNRDSVINGKNYRVFTNSSGGNEYYFQSGSDYYQQASLTGVDKGLELLYLKANQSVGASWEETKQITVNLGGSPVSIPTKFTYTIEEKLASYAVGSLNFSDVIKVRVVLQPTGVTINSQNLVFYYAPKAGRIKSQIRMSVVLAGIDVDTETTLQAYTIVP